MKKLELEIYKFSELSAKAKKKAISAYKYDIIDEEDYFWAREFIDSLKGKILKATGVVCGIYVVGIDYSFELESSTLIDWQLIEVKSFKKLCKFLKVDYTETIAKLKFADALDKKDFLSYLDILGHKSVQQERFERKAYSAIQKKINEFEKELKQLRNSLTTPEKVEKRLLATKYNFDKNGNPVNNAYIVSLLKNI